MQTSNNSPVHKKAGEARGRAIASSQDHCASAMEDRQTVETGCSHSSVAMSETEDDLPLHEKNETTLADPTNSKWQLSVEKNDRKQQSESRQLPTPLKRKVLMTLEDEVQSELLSRPSLINASISGVNDRDHCWNFSASQPSKLSNSRSPETISRQSRSVRQENSLAFLERDIQAKLCARSTSASTSETKPVTPTLAGKEDHRINDLGFSPKSPTGALSLLDVISASSTPQNNTSRNENSLESLERDILAKCLSSTTDKSPAPETQDSSNNYGRKLERTDTSLFTVPMPDATIPISLVPRSSLAALEREIQAKCTMGPTVMSSIPPSKESRKENSLASLERDVQAKNCALGSVVDRTKESRTMNSGKECVWNEMTVPKDTIAPHLLDAAVPTQLVQPISKPFRQESSLAFLEREIQAKSCARGGVDSTIETIRGGRCSGIDGNTSSEHVSFAKLNTQDERPIGRENSLASLELGIHKSCGKGSVTGRNVSSMSPENNPIIYDPSAKSSPRDARSSFNVEDDSFTERSSKMSGLSMTSIERDIHSKLSVRGALAGKDFTPVSPCLNEEVSALATHDPNQDAFLRGQTTEVNSPRSSIGRIALDGLETDLLTKHMSPNGENGVTQHSHEQHVAFTELSRMEVELQRKSSQEHVSDNGMGQTEVDLQQVCQEHPGIERSSNDCGGMSPNSVQNRRQHRGGLRTESVNRPLGAFYVAPSGIVTIRSPGALSNHPTTPMQCELDDHYVVASESQVVEDSQSRSANGRSECSPERQQRNGSKGVQEGISTTFFRRDGMLALAALIVGIVVGTVLYFVLSGDSSKNVSSPLNPDLSTEVLLVRTIVEGVVSSSESLNNTLSPQHAALQWVASDSSTVAVIECSQTVVCNRGATLQKLIRRYSLAVFYFALDGPSWFSSLNWLDTEIDECKWEYIVCNISGSIWSIDTGGSHQNLSGEIPIEVQALSTLTELRLPRNNITGSACQFVGLKSLDLSKNAIDGLLPDFLRTATTLEYLDLGENLLSGTIPFWFSELSLLTVLKLPRNNLSGRVAALSPLAMLQILDLSSNSFTGQPVADFTNFTGIQELHIGLNEFSGSIGAMLTPLLALQFLDAQANAFSGGLPSHIGLMTHLTSIRLSKNSIEGTIPSEIGRLGSTLLEFELDQNQVFGSIPTEVGMLTSLTELLLNFNSLTGPIPSEIGALSELAQVDVSSNFLNGGIPTELGHCTDLISLKLNRNELTGAVPSEIGGMQSLLELRLEQNAELTGSLPAEVCELKKLEYIHTPCTVSCACSTCSPCL